MNISDKKCPTCGASVVILILNNATGQQFCHHCGGKKQEAAIPSTTYQARSGGIAWHELSADFVKVGNAAFLSSDGGLHTCNASAVRHVLEMDEDAQILATNPEEWRTFVREQRLIFLDWCCRETFTDFDAKWLREMGVVWEVAPSRRSFRQVSQ
jgi:hypothetical protein